MTPSRLCIFIEPSFGLAEPEYDVASCQSEVVEHNGLIRTKLEKFVKPQFQFWNFNNADVSQCLYKQLYKCACQFFQIWLFNFLEGIAACWVLLYVEDLDFICWALYCILCFMSWWFVFLFKKLLHHFY